MTNRILETIAIVLLVLIAQPFPRTITAEPPGRIAVLSPKNEAFAWNDDKTKGDTHEALLCELTVIPKQFYEQQGFSIEIVFSEVKERTLYNPMFNPLLPAPAIVVLYDANKNIVSKYGLHSGGSRMLPSRNDWVRLDVGGLIGKRIPLFPDQNNTGIGWKYPLKPGKYFAQAIVFERILSRPPVSDLKNEEMSHYWQQWQHHYRDEEFIRSNVVEYEYHY